MARVIGVRGHPTCDRNLQRSTRGRAARRLPGSRTCVAAFARASNGVRTDEAARSHRAQRQNARACGACPNTRGRRAAGVVGGFACLGAAFLLGTQTGSRSADSSVVASAVQNRSTATAKLSSTVDTREGVSRAIGLALAGDPDSVTALISQIDADSSSWPAAARERMRHLRLLAARRHFATGLETLRAGSASEATRHLATAARLGAGTYIEDDALYELSRAQWRAGANADAARTARRLLTDFPTSLYANSTMRALAASTPNGVSQ